MQRTNKLRLSVISAIFVVPLIVLAAIPGEAPIREDSHDFDLITTAHWLEVSTDLFDIVPARVLLGSNEPSAPLAKSLATVGVSRRSFQEVARRMTKRHGVVDVGGLSNVGVGLHALGLELGDLESVESRVAPSQTAEALLIQSLLMKLPKPRRQRRN